MLELRNIVKDYVSGDNVTHALKGVSVNFRKNEFVSILGASGCGKTTTLNIIGGLDRYTDGDLLINGKSTKEYKDRDWDTYRNHSIGFVFQTYNLISHQNILKNVELALTISGVSKEERRERAYKVLKTVGLEGMEKKRPNQLSGGQCQRVAIARALINNPEILLADEPTGALDSETSVQIMDLLKEVASDRLVIMVTHNPDLANTYSTRIIRMSDGLLISDTNPFDGKGERITKKLENSLENSDFSKGKKKQTSMSIWTSIGLSTSNLLSKMKRTVLVTIAGSIGIIGVSAVLGVSRGVREYISDLQNDMLSSYPITIAEESVDYTKLITGLSNQNTRDKFEFDPNDPKVGVDSMISYLMDTYNDMTNVKTNTIDQKLIDFVYQMPKEDYGVIRENYAIDPTNNIFGKWKDETTETENYYSFNGLTQRYIKELKTVKGFGSYASFVDLFTSFMNELPDNNEYITDQYDVIAGEYKTGEDDLVLVVDQDTTLTDIVLAQTGVFDHKSFLNIAKCAMAEQDFKKSEGYEKLTDEQKNEEIKKIRDEYPYDRTFNYGDLIDRKFYYFPQDTIYSEDPHVADDRFTASVNFHAKDGGGDLDMFASLSYQSLYGYNLLYGNIIYKNGSDYKTDTIAFLNSSAMTGTTAEAQSVEDLAGNWFGFDMSDLRSLDPNDMSTITDALKYTLMINKSTGKVTLIPKGETYPFKWSNIDPQWDPRTEPVEGFSYQAVANNTWIENLSDPAVNGKEMKITSILRLKDNKKFGSLSRGLYYSHEFGKKFINDSKDGIVTREMKKHMSGTTTYNTQFDKAFVKYPYYDHSDKQIKEYYASTLNGDLSSSFSDLFMSFGGTDYTETNAVHLRSVCGYKAIYNYDEDEKFVDANFELLPREIQIYPKSFEGKDKVTNHLDRWNSEETLEIKGVEYTRVQRDELTYTDTISLIAAVIDTFINAITIALVVFTSLSLVVSCFMIAVITYISVVERIKEIGVIRSLGGRKRDVAGLFIMETMMTGLFSGIFGVTFTYILQIIVNIILKSMFGLAIMHLTWFTALLMIGISVTLSVLSGLIPSQSAAHKDPVVALRSNE